MEAWITRLNTKLFRCKITVPGKGRDSLILVATLPGKTDPTRKSQQKISTGCKLSDPESRVKIRELANRLDDQIEAGTFSWAEWTKDKLKELSLIHI